MKKNLFLSLFLVFLSSRYYSQQFWEHELNSKEEQFYKSVLKKNRIKSISTFYHYKKGSPPVPEKIYKLDKMGNILVVIQKANQDIKKDVEIEKNSFDKKGNLISHVEYSNNVVDTMKYVICQYDSLNNITSELNKEWDYIVGKDNKLERIYKVRNYTYENKYNSSGKIINQLKKYNSIVVLRTEFIYDQVENLIEIKKYLKESACLESWIKFSYEIDSHLKEKFYPSYSCDEGNSKATMNNNKYIYKYNKQNQFTELEHSNSGQLRGKILYTYNSAGLLVYIAPDDDFGYYDASVKYEFYKN